MPTRWQWSRRNMPTYRPHEQCPNLLYRERILSQEEMGFQQDDHNEVSPCIRGLGDLHKTSNVYIKRMVRSNGNLNTELSILATKEVKMS